MSETSKRVLASAKMATASDACVLAREVTALESQLATARHACQCQWRPLTEDPATWPEESMVVVRARENHALTLTWWGEYQRRAWQQLGWTHWLPLPDPPKELTYAYAQE